MSLLGWGTLLGGVGSLLGASRSSNTPGDPYRYLSKGERKGLAQSVAQQQGHQTAISGTDRIRSLQGMQMEGLGLDRMRMEQPYISGRLQRAEELSKFQHKEAMLSHPERVQRSLDYAKAINPDAYKTGTELGEKHRDFMEASAPGVSQLARLGISPAPEVAAQQGQTSSTQQASMMQLEREKLSTSRQIAETQAMAQIKSAQIASGGTAAGSLFGAGATIGAAGIGARAQMVGHGLTAIGNAQETFKEYAKQKVLVKIEDMKNKSAQFIARMIQRETTSREHGLQERQLMFSEKALRENIAMKVQEIEQGFTRLNLEQVDSAERLVRTYIDGDISQDAFYKVALTKFGKKFADMVRDVFSLRILSHTIRHGPR